MLSSVLLCALALPGIEVEGVDYARDIKPLLAEHCVRCHGVKKQESGLRLDTAALAKRGGDSGPAIVSGKPADSLLVRALTGVNDVSQMPPEGEGKRLNDEQVRLIKRWIEQGAPAPEN